MYPDKYSDIVSDRQSGSIYGIFILLFYLTISDILSGIYLDILSNILDLAYTLAISSILSVILSCIYSDIFQAFILAFYPTSILTFYLSFFFWHSIQAPFLALYLTFCAGILSGIYTNILSDTGAAGPAHCPLGSGARSWAPAVPTAHWDLELAVVENGTKNAQLILSTIWGLECIIQRHAQVHKPQIEMLWAGGSPNCIKLLTGLKFWMDSTTLDVRKMAEQIQIAYVSVQSLFGFSISFTLLVDKIQ